jgi:hypothetical protein
MLSTASSGISIQDRLESGNLTISEVCDLKRRSRSGFYADLKAGLVQIRKQGRISVVPGPIARRYINGDQAHDQPKENAV